MTSFIHIGIADWCEIGAIHGKKYKKGIGIEAIPNSASIARSRADYWNKQHGTQFEVLNYCITNTDDDIVNYNIASNNGHSSSIYPMKEHKEIWKDVSEVGQSEFKTKRMMTIVKENNINLLEYEDLIVDVQGAELEVLKSFDGNIRHFKTIEVEISTKELYEGQVLFPELNQYLEDHGFKKQCEPHTFHCNLIYDNINENNNRS
jgi:FkbM family methyltransferase